MEREFDRLREGGFDLLVIGGGAPRAWIAYDAALRGLSVAMVEQRDWPATGPGACSELMLGGVRHLERGRADLLRRRVEEATRLSDLAPHGVRPLGFVLPLYSGSAVTRARLKLSCWLYRRLAGAELPAVQRSGLGRRELVERFDLREDGLLCGLGLSDFVYDEARLTLELVDGAVRAGAVAVNGARATALLTRGPRVIGAVVEDLEGGRAIEVRAAVTVHGAARQGSAAPEPTVAAHSPRAPVLRDVQLVLPALGLDEGLLLLPQDDDRLVYLIPWYGRTLVGTTVEETPGALPPRAGVEDAEMRYLLARTRQILGRTHWQPADVIAAFAVRRTAGDAVAAPSGGEPEGRPAEPARGLLAPSACPPGAARLRATVVVDRAFELLGRPPVPSITDGRPLPWCPAGPYREWSKRTFSAGLSLGLDEEMVETCLVRYGASVDALFERVAASPLLAQRIVPDAPFCLAEIVHAVEHEMARTLEDVLRRRIPLALVSRLSFETLGLVAEMVGHALGWTQERRRHEIESLAAVGAPVHVPA